MASTRWPPHGQDGVLDDGVGVDGGDRGIVDRAGGDGDRHGRDGAAVGGVVGGVGEGVGADEVGVGGVDEGAVGGQDRGAVGDVGDQGPVRVVPASGSESLASTRWPPAGRVLDTVSASTAATGGSLTGLAVTVIVTVVTALLSVASSAV